MDSFPKSDVWPILRGIFLEPEPTPTATLKMSMNEATRLTCFVAGVVSLCIATNRRRAIF